MRQEENQVLKQPNYVARTGLTSYHPCNDANRHRSISFTFATSDTLVWAFRLFFTQFSAYLPITIESDPSNKPWYKQISGIPSIQEKGKNGKEHTGDDVGA